MSSSPILLAAWLALASGAASAPMPAKETTRVDDVAGRPDRGDLAVTQTRASPPRGGLLRLAAPLGAEDRCEPILLGRAPPEEGLDCTASKLGRQLSAPSRAPPEAAIAGALGEIGAPDDVPTTAILTPWP